MKTTAFYISCISVLMTISQIGLAQSIAAVNSVSTSTLVDEEISKGEGDTSPVVHKNVFDLSLIPCSDLYDDAWDSMNVDVPKFSKTDVASCMEFPLVDGSGCSYVHPFHGDVTSNFGWRRYRMHKGVDIDLVTGDSVRAAFDGVVRIAKYNYGGFGHYVVIRHYNGVETLYGHLSKRMVRPNDVIKAGEVLGLGGNTGRSTGSHLHFEVRYRGQAIDPNQIISFEDGQLSSDTLYLDMEDYSYLHSANAAYNTGNGKVYHKMRYGDTLWALSRKYGTSVTRICRLNGISSRTTLRVGRVIRVR